jgi:hypothetical protein
MNSFPKVIVAFKDDDLWVHKTYSSSDARWKEVFSLIKESGREVKLIYK